MQKLLNLLRNNRKVSKEDLLLFKTYFHNLVDEAQLAGIQTAILRKGKLIYFDTYGHADIERDKPLDTKSIFRIFSMTKPIVSVALMQLYEQGKFQLEDPLYKFIPAFKEMYVLQDSIIQATKNPIRIIDLLRHTSGFNYGRGANPQLNSLYAAAGLHASENNEEFVQKMSTLPLQFEPGTDWQYGLSTNICGYLIEVLSGQSLDVYLQENIFDPLDMRDTHFQLPKEKIDRFTVGYRWSEEGQLIIAEAPEESRFVQDVSLFNGGGGLLSTTFDYLTFSQMLLDNGLYKGSQIIKKTSIDLMFADHLKTVRTHQENRLRLPNGEASFGLGFAIKGDSPDELKAVYGWGGAVGTYFKIDTKNELVYILMIQLSPYRHLELRESLQDFVNASVIDKNGNQ